MQLLSRPTTGYLSSCHCCASHQCCIILGSDLEMILKPWLPSLAPCGGRWQCLVAESYTCQLVEPRSTPHFLDAKIWGELPSLTVTSTALQFPPRAVQGSPRFDQSRDGSRAWEWQLRLAVCLMHRYAFTHWLSYFSSIPQVSSDSVLRLLLPPCPAWCWHTSGGITLMPLGFTVSVTAEAILRCLQVGIILICFPHFIM